ncbi:hypothetical protein ABPG73_006127 [Tetrahymena malaccensis]
MSTDKPKSINIEQQQKLIEALRKSSTLSIPQLMQRKAIQKMEIETCSKTVLNTIWDLGFIRIRQKGTHFISEQNIQNREDGYKQRQNWKQYNFDRILFSDESFIFHDYYRKDFIRKRESQAWNHKMIEYQKQHPQKVLVRALISHIR